MWSMKLFHREIHYVPNSNLKEMSKPQNLCKWCDNRAFRIMSAFAGHGFYKRFNFDLSLQPTWAIFSYTVILDLVNSPPFMNCDLKAYDGMWTVTWSEICSQKEISAPAAGLTTLQGRQSVCSSEERNATASVNWFFFPFIYLVIFDKVLIYWFYLSFSPPNKFKFLKVRLLGEYFSW